MLRGAGAGRVLKYALCPCRHLTIDVLNSGPKVPTISPFAQNILSESVGSIQVAPPAIGHVAGCAIPAQLDTSIKARHFTNAAGVLESQHPNDADNGNNRASVPVTFTAGVDFVLSKPWLIRIVACSHSLSLLLHRLQGSANPVLLARSGSDRLECVL